MPTYEVTMAVCVRADTADEAYDRAIAGQFLAGMTIVEEDGIRRLPDPIVIDLSNGIDEPIEEEQA